MSLLMDALRKAEEAKRQTPADAPAPETPELSLAPLEAGAPAKSPSAPAATRVPEFAEQRASLAAEISAAFGEAAPRTRAASADERLAARNLFSAKTTQRPRRPPWLLVATSGAVAVLGIGAYFWWQLHAISGGLQAQQASPATAVVSAASPAPTAPSASAPTPTAAPAVPVPAVAAVAVPAAPPSPAPQHAAPAARPSALAAKAPPARTSAALPASVRAAPNAAGSDDPPLRLSASRPPPAPTIDRAFDALQAGRLEEAQRDYAQVLRNEPKNTDAWLGLATIAARRGQSELAQGYYQRALEADPSDPTAQAGLLNGRGQSDPALAESRLKGALDTQPASSALHFALGNLYARQARWGEAQQSYFRAYAVEPDNAEIIFNLAVSLDHLHQNKLAAQYYQRALSAAPGNNAQFDTQQVARRIQELQP